jgi:hypothetical protein
MPGAANDVWWDDLRQEAELPPPEPPTRSRAPIIAGLVAATAIAGGLGWWLSSPSKTYFDNPTIQAAPAEAARVARPTADPEQVRRAYDEFGLVYASSGDEGLTRFAESCQASLRADPRILDFCLAFELFADTVRDPLAEPAGKAQARRVALVQSAAPGADPDVRIAEVRRLMREATGFTTAQAASAPPTEAPVQTAQAPPAAGPPAPASTPAVRAAPAPTAAPPARAVRVAKATPPRKAAAASSACRLRSTPAERLMCANPTLRIQERRMKEAYERALGAGADPLVVDRAQAEWRTLRNAADTRGELADLYARRTRELNAAAETAASTPPT